MKKMKTRGRRRQESRTQREAKAKLMKKERTMLRIWRNSTDKLKHVKRRRWKDQEKNAAKIAKSNETKGKIEHEIINRRGRRGKICCTSLR